MVIGEVGSLGEQKQLRLEKDPTAADSFENLGLSRPKGAAHPRTGDFYDRLRARVDSNYCSWLAVVPSVLA